MHGMNIKIKYINLGNAHFVGLYRIIIVQCMVQKKKQKSAVCISSVTAINVTFQAVIMSLFLFSFQTVNQKRSQANFPYARDI